jgi:hypothetical protein
MYPLCETLWKVSQTPNSKQQPHCTEHCTTRACLTQQQHSEPRVRTAYVHVAPLAKPRTQHTNSTVAYIANRSTTATHPHGCAYIASHCSNAVHRHRSSSLACLHCSTHRSKWAHAHTHIRGCAERSSAETRRRLLQTRSTPSATAADGAVSRSGAQPADLPERARREEAAEASLAAAEAIPPLLGTIDHAAAHCP